MRTLKSRYLISIFGICILMAVGCINPNSSGPGNQESLGGEGGGPGEPDNELPIGFFDSIVVNQANQTCHVNGWALDPDHLEGPTVVDFYTDSTPLGPGTLITSVITDVYRQGVVTLHNPNGTFGDYGFSVPVPYPLCNGPYIYVFAHVHDVDDPSLTTELARSPQRMGNVVTANNPAKFNIQNGAPTPRTQIATVTIPFAKGQYSNLDDIRKLAVVGAENETTVRPLAWFGNSSIMAAQLQFPISLAASERRNGVSVVEIPSVPSHFYQPFQVHPWMASRSSGLSVRFRVRIAGVDYETDIGPQLRNIAQGNIVDQNFNMLSKSFDAYLYNVTSHQNRLRYPARYPIVAGQDKPPLYVRIYATYSRVESMISVFALLSNAFHGEDNPASADPKLYPTGSLLIERAEIIANGLDHFGLKYPEFNSAGPVTQNGNQYQTILFSNRVMHDGTASAYNLNIGFIDPNAAPGQTSTMQSTFNAMDYVDAFALADFDTWEDKTPLIGGILRGNSSTLGNAINTRSNCIGALNNRQSYSYQAFPISCNVVEATSTTGTPRNYSGGISEEGGIQAIQAEEPLNLAVAKYRFMTQFHRIHNHPSFRHSNYNERILMWDSAGLPWVPGGRKLRPESLGRQLLYGQPGNNSVNGQNYNAAQDPYPQIRTGIDMNRQAEAWDDPEHFTSTNTTTAAILLGDPAAIDYTRMAAEITRTVLYRDNPLYNIPFGPSFNGVARTAGWGIQVLLSAYVLQPDQYLRDSVEDFSEHIYQRRYDPSHPSQTWSSQEVQPGHSWFSPPWQHQESVQFTMAWQMGYALVEILAVHHILDHLPSLQLAELAIQAIEYSRVRNYTDPNGNFVANGFRKYTALKMRDASGSFQFIPANLWDQYGIEWGGSPLGGVNTTIPTGAYYMSERASNQTLRTMAFDIAHLWTNPDPNSKWRNRIPERLR